MQQCYFRFTIYARQYNIFIVLLLQTRICYGVPRGVVDIKLFHIVQFWMRVYMFGPQTATERFFFLKKRMCLEKIAKKSTKERRFISWHAVWPTHTETMGTLQLHTTYIYYLNRLK